MLTTEYNRQSLYFTGTSQVIVKEESLPGPGPTQVLVQTQLSAISSGTELLVYRGQVPADLPVDETISSLAGRFEYPLQYGYAAVGTVCAAGSQVDPTWLNRSVFAFYPHASHFVLEPEALIPVPAGVSPEEAVFLANMETAVTLLMDGRPMIAERVAVFGQGIVGLLTAALLARFPLAALVTLDRYPLRREASRKMGAHASLDPDDPQTLNRVREALAEGGLEASPDLIYELSGTPRALDQAIALAPFHSRIVVGSWYGQKRANLDLGGRFHRQRITLSSSQVSSLAPEHSGRWTKQRRLMAAWDFLRLVQPSRLITQQIPLRRAFEAYQLLDQRPDTAIQVVLTYP